MKTRQRILRALGAGAFLLCLIACVGCALVAGMSGQGALYLDCFYRYADTRDFGVEPAQYPALAYAVGGYLSGARSSPQAEIIRDGAPAPAFNPKELTHLSDVRALMDSLRRAAWVTGMAAVALSLFMCLLDRGAKRGAAYRRAAARACFAGFCGALAFIAAAALWAALDFNGAFYGMHKLLFTNDLWLLNPRTDLLIALMPSATFSRLAGQLLLRLLPVLLCALVALALLARRAFRPLTSEETP